MLICPSESFSKNAIPIEMRNGDIVYITQGDIKSIRFGEGLTDFATINLKPDNGLARETGLKSFQTKQKSEISIFFYGYDMTKPDPETDAFTEQCHDLKIDPCEFLDQPYCSRFKLVS